MTKIPILLDVAPPIGDDAHILRSIETILLTGGTGTFGTAAVDRLLADPTVRRVVVYSRDEAKQAELTRRLPDPRLLCVIGDVRDAEAVREVMALEPYDLVIHAAALKQVGTGEAFPQEVIKTNVRGAEHVIAAALHCQVGKVIALSTDKAVAPANLYGRTKAVAENLFVAANRRAKQVGAPTRFAIVRYGNVIGSRGSVVPLFVEQARTGVLRVTDRQATRFWMPLNQAVDTVLYTAHLMTGGEIVVPKIPSARVVDVALAIGPDCRVEETGLAVGEKLHEVLIAPEEFASTYDAGEVYVIASTPRGTPVSPAFSYRSDDRPQPVRLVEQECA